MSDFLREVVEKALRAVSVVEAKADAGEPVAWMRYLQGDVFQCDKDRDDAFPVYTRPAPADGALLKDAAEGWLGQWKCDKCARILEKSNQSHYGYPLGPDHVPYELCDGKTSPHERRSTRPAPADALREDHL